ncbi:MAG TPA: VWA domain-containing protein [Bacillus sp. (in: firmicutes)]|nr:VWA domain-containing protein [Bacillus sp. (in: firmicutes)]
MKRNWLKKGAVALFSLTLAMLVGCGNEEQAAKPKEENKNTTEEIKKTAEDVKKKPAELEAFYNAPEAPKNYAEVLEYPAGEMAGKRFEEKESEFKKVLDEFPALPEDASEEQVKGVYNKLVQLYKQDYPQPPGIVAQEDLGNPNDLEQEQQPSYNVEIILDASGSMAGKVSGKTKMELAKEAIREFAGSLPEGAKVGLRVYGHKGSNEEKDKALSCQSSELIYSINTYNEQQLQSALNSFQPTGWTPVAKSLQEASNDLSAFQGEQHKNIIYLVSDGIETCGGDPAAEAKKLKESNIAPVVNVIGFDVDDAGQKQLEQVASASGGNYVSVNSQDELKKEFNKAKEDAESWHKWFMENKEKISKTGMANQDAFSKYRSISKNLVDDEAMNYLKSIDYLQETKKITYDQNAQIHSWFLDYTRDIGEVTNEIYHEGFSASHEEYRKKMDELFETYRANN